MNSAARVRCLLLRAFPIAMLALVSMSSTAFAQTLAWNANTEPDLAGYIVQYGTQSGNPSTSQDVGNVTSRAMTGLTPGATYYFRVLAYNTTGQQSAPSAEVSYVVPGTPLPAPTITSFTPTSGPTTGATVVTINGSNFVSGATVRFGSAAGTGVTFVSASQLRATTPAGSGAVSVQVTNPSGQSATAASQFTYTSTGGPTITSVSPNSGPTAGGTTITINGSGYVMGSGGEVRVGGVLCTGIQYISSTQLRANTPAAAAGARDVTVRNPNGATVTLTGGFTYIAPATAPTLTSVSPTSGPTTGGTTITLTGTNFVSGATVRVGGTAATSVTFVSATQLTARTPTGTAGARDVQVTNPDGQSATRTGAFTYTASTAPTLTSVSPNSGTTAGGTTITLTGTNFVSGATVRVGGTAATNVTFVSATQLTARTPAGTAGARDVQVTNPNGQAVTLTGGFTYTSSTAPTITSVSPSSGPTGGGTVITITGSNYVLGSGGEIRVGGVMCTNIQYISSTQLRATTPAGTAGARDVYIRNPNGQTVTRTGGFTYTSGTQSLQTMTADTTRYLAEGVQTTEMNTQLAIANAESTDANVNLTFMTAAGETSQLAMTVPARSRQTVDASAVPELAGTSFSTLLESDTPVALDRLVTLDAAGAAATLETAVAQPSARWYFAEGSTVDPFELFYLVQNPGETPAQVQVRYLLPSAAPVTKSYTVAAHSRATIWVDREAASLTATDVAAEITSIDGTPIVVERSLYLKDAGSVQPRGGDTSTGATALAATWFLEGSTAQATTRLLLANPGTGPVRVRAVYQLANGTRVPRSYTVAAASRLSVDVAREHPALAGTAFSVRLDATSPIVAERTIWWGANGRLDEAVSGTGVTAGGARWLIAEAQLGGARGAATSVSVLNQGAATDVTVTLLFEDGPEVFSSFPVAAGARLDVPLAEAFPTAEGRRFSVLIEGADATASLVVDRAIFWQAAGGARTAGADGAATPLR